MPDSHDTRPASADRNLLFGILAVQMDFLSRDALIQGMHAWVLKKDRPLGQILVELGALRSDTRNVLEALVDKHLEVHHQDPAQSLAAIGSSGTFRENLEGIADPDIQASLGHVRAPGPRAPDPYATRVDSLGTPSSTGTRFQILRPFAKGGLGEVLVAHDDELGREVVVKRIQDRHADDPNSRSRFLLEAEITGRLEHPGVVPVYGLGRYEDGRPFYAMRFVKGASLKEAIEDFHREGGPGHDPSKRTLALRKLLGRFIGVCDAVSYAHSRGILHRDLKPANILLGPYGETLVVDWGLAKAMGQRSVGASDAGQTTGPTYEPTLRPMSVSGSQATQMGLALGTPQYMSPEQAEGRLDQLGPTSDVYSLGATLYCLLTGKPAFQDPDIIDVLRKVERGIFPPPRQVNADVPLGLEAVCLKAMAHKPDDRYPTARALADDIEHWLADEPVTAHQEPWSLRARRWLRRHQTVVVGASAAVIVAIASLAAGTIVLAQAYRSLRDANEQERQARLEADASADRAETSYRLARAANEQERQARLEASASADRAETSYRLARAALDQAMQLQHDPRFQQGPLEDVRRQLLRAEASFYQQFVQLRGDDSHFQAEQANAFLRLGYLTRMLASMEEAIGHYREGLRILASLSQAYPDVAAYRSDLATAYLNLGNLYQETGRAMEAEEVLQKARVLREQFVRDHPGVASYQADLAATDNNLGVLYRAIGRSQEAEQALQQARSVRERLMKEEPTVARYQVDLVKSLSNLGGLYQHTGRAKEAEDALTAARTLAERLVAEHPKELEHQEELARACRSLGLFYGVSGRFTDALGPYRKAQEMFERLAREHPMVVAHHAGLANVLSNLGNVYYLTGQYKEAEEAYRLALARQQDLARNHPTVPAYQAGLASTHNNLANIYKDSGRLAEAVTAVQQALTLLEQLAKAHPQVTDNTVLLAGSYQHLGELLRDQDKPVDALEWYGKGATLLEGVLKKEPRHAEAAHYLCDGCLGRAVALARLRRHAEALQAADAWVEKKGLSGDALYDLARVYALCVARTEGEPATADKQIEQHATRALDFLQRARSAGFFSSPANRESWKRDRDFDPLRTRPDFKKLVAGWESTTRK
jgi:serine/threonine-protein kinase